MHPLEHSGADRLVGPITNPVGPVGPYVARGPVGSYGMLSPCNSDQLVADGPVGPYVPEPLEHSVLGLSVSFPDQPVADGPVGPYVARGLVGSYGMLSPCDSDQLVTDGPVGPYFPEPLEHSVLGLSMHSGADRSVGPSIDPVGPVGPYVTHDPVGSYGMLSPCNSDSGPDQPVADGPVGPYVPEPLEHSVMGLFMHLLEHLGADQSVGPSIDPVGPVGPYVTRVQVGSYGMLSPCNSDFDPDQPVADGLVGSYASCRPVGSSGTLSPGDSDSTGPVMPVKMLPLSPHGGGECMDRHDEWSGSDVVGTPSSVAVVDLRAGSTVSVVSSNGGDECEDWDSGYQCEIIDGVTVYYGGDLCDSEDSEESDWEDPEDVTRREHMEDYNFDLLEGMEPMVFVPSGKTSGLSRQNEYQSYLYDGNDARVPDDDSIVDRKRRTWREYCASIFRKGLAPFPSDAPASPPRNGRRDKRCSHEDCMDMMPPEHLMGLRDIAHVLTSVPDEDEDGSDTSVSSHVEILVLTLDSEVVVVKERTVGVWGLPLTVCNSRFRNGASDGILSSEGMK